MGWAHGQNNDGREVGYGVVAQCDHPKCRVIIDRGMAYMCGNIVTAVTFGGIGPGCGKYFCFDHDSWDVHNCTHPPNECVFCGEQVEPGEKLCEVCIEEGVTV